MNARKAAALPVSITQSFLRNRSKDALSARPLQFAHGLVIDDGGLPDVLDLGAPFTLERLCIIHHPDADELRIDRHRAERRVRRRLRRCKLVQRQNLQHRLTRGEKPPCKRGNVANLPDSPTAGRTKGKQRHVESRTARARHHCWAPILMKSACTAAANTWGSGSRLTTRNASRSKSKK